MQPLGSAPTKCASCGDEMRFAPQMNQLRLRCGHVFHQTCFEPISTSQNQQECPVCPRQVVVINRENGDLSDYAGYGVAILVIAVIGVFVFTAPGW